MKTKIKTLPGAVLALLVLTLTTNAATGPCATTPTTQVYDLKTDWSDTQNPNGTWSYREFGFLLISDPVPWSAYPSYIFDDRISRTAESDVIPGKLEFGDIFMVYPDNSLGPRWTAPAAGTINVSATVWSDTGLESVDW